MSHRLERVARALFFAAAIVALALVIIPVTTAVAATTGLEPVDCQGLGINCEQSDSTSTLLEYIRTVLNVVLAPVGIAAVIALIYGGIQYITSSGDSNKAGKAKTTILYALAGIVVIGLSFVAVNFVLGAIIGQVR